MAEPERLRAGKDFQRIVQEDFRLHSRDGRVRPERSLKLTHGVTRRRTGRMDILIDDLGDFVTVLEIKATDWDRIKPKNVTRNLYRHQRQLLTYVDQYVEGEGITVVLGMIYPRPPRKEGLRQRVEEYLMEYGIPTYWYSEIRTK